MAKSVKINAETTRKDELIAKAAKKSGLSQKVTELAGESIFEVIQEELENGNHVEWYRKFQFFIYEFVGTTKRRNPQTGEDVIIEPHQVVRINPLLDFTSIFKRDKNK